MKQKGFAHILLILLLLIGLGVGVYLVQQKTNILPKASQGEPTAPETSIVLSTQKNGFYYADELIPVYVNIRSDVAFTNLVRVKLNFDKEKLAVDSILPFDKSETGEHNSPPVFSKWDQNDSDADSGTVNLIAEISEPGYKSESGSPSARMATIKFRSLKPAVSSINVATSIASDSAIYSKGVDLLPKNQKSLEITTIEGVMPTAVALPSVPPPAASGMPGIPQIPHQLYGTVTINGRTAGAGVVISAKINGQEVAHVSTDANSHYGYQPADFMIPGENRGSTVQLYIGNEAAQTTVVENGKVEQLNLSVPVSVASSPTAIPTVTPSSEPTPVSRAAQCDAVKADMNKDGTIDLSDLSLFNSAKIDINDDGVVSLHDYSCMIHFLIENKVIKG